MARHSFCSASVTQDLIYLYQSLDASISGNVVITGLGDNEASRGCCSYKRGELAWVLGSKDLPAYGRQVLELHTKLLYCCHIKYHLDPARTHSKPSGLLRGPHPCAGFSRVRWPHPQRASHMQLALSSVLGVLRFTSICSHGVGQLVLAFSERSDIHWYFGHSRTFFHLAFLWDP